MNSTAKITSLVAVLALCCAALAGSAYAYTATYVDTIDDQDIDDVYIVVKATNDGKYGALDVDLENSTFSETVNTAAEGQPAALVDKIYFHLDKAVVQSAGANYSDAFITEVTDGKSVRIAVLIDTVTITAFGEDASKVKTLDALSDSGSAISFAYDGTHGVSAFVHLTETKLTASTVSDPEGYETLTIDKTVPNEGLTAYAYLILDIKQLDGDVVKTFKGVNYFNTKAEVTIEDFTFSEFDVYFYADAEQVTA